MENELIEIIKSGGIVLIQFIESNCEPCAMNEPILQQVKNILGNRVNINVVAMDEVPRIVEFYKIEVAPTIICFQNGVQIWKTSEVMSKQKLLEKILDVV